MKQIIASRTVDIPEGITMEVKARKVRVKGPRGAAQLLGVVKRVLIGSALHISSPVPAAVRGARLLPECSIA